jgi:hypothetical protein
MSLEEAGLLLELEAMGKEQIADRPKVPVENTVIEKVEKVRPVRAEIKKVDDPADDETAFSALPAAVLLAAEVTEPTAEKTGPRLAAQPKAEEQVPSPGDPDVNPRSVSSGEPLPDALIITEHEAADTEHIFAEIQLPYTDEKMPAPALAEPAPEVAGAEHEVAGTDRYAPEEAAALVAGNPDVGYGPIEAAEVIPATDTLEQSEAEYNDSDTGMILPGAFGAVRAGGDEQIEVTEGESRSLPEAPELGAPLAQIEAAIVQLVAALENDAADKAVKTGAILEEIIRLPGKVEAVPKEDSGIFEEKLEELFLELFEEADIGYSPGLIKSYARLTRAHYAQDPLEVPAAPGEETYSLPDEIGTREFLQKLQYGLSDMKQAAVNFYEIGKSILHIYSYGLEIAARKAA